MSFNIYDNILSLESAKKRIGADLNKSINSKDLSKVEAIALVSLANSGVFSMKDYPVLKQKINRALNKDEKDTFISLDGNDKLEVNLNKQAKSAVETCNLIELFCLKKKIKSLSFEDKQDLFLSMERPFASVDVLNALFICCNSEEISKLAQHMRIDDFNLIDYKELTLDLKKELAKICANDYDFEITGRIRDFGFDAKTEEGRKALLEIGKMVAAKNGYAISANIKNFGFEAKTEEGRAALLEIAKIAAAQNGKQVSIHIKNFGFNAKTEQGRAALLEIGKIAASQDDWATSEYIKNFGFDANIKEGREALLKIAKISVMQHNGAPTINFIKNYGFNAKTEEGREALLEIGKIAAAQNGWLVSRNIKNFDFDINIEEERKALLEIGKIAAAQNGKDVAPYIENYGFDAKVERDRVALLEIGKNAAMEGSDHILRILKNDENFKSVPIVDFLQNQVGDIEDEHAQEQVLILLRYLYLRSTFSEVKDLVDFLPRWKETFKEILAIQDPKLRFDLVEAVIEVVENKPERPSAGILNSVFVNLFETKNSPVDVTLLENIEKFTKDSLFKREVLSLLIELKKDENISGQLAQKIVMETFEQVDKLDIVKHSLKIRAIIDLKGSDLLESQNDLDTVLCDALKRAYPSLTDKIDNFGNAFAETFLKSRSPYAIFTYAGA